VARDTAHVEWLKATCVVTLDTLYLGVEALEWEAALRVVVKLEVLEVSLLVTAPAGARLELTLVDVLVTAYAVT